MLPLLPPPKSHNALLTVEEDGDQARAQAPTQERESNTFTTVAVYRSICWGEESASQQTPCAFLVSYQVNQIYLGVLNPLNKAEMRCNACWRELDGRAVATTCGHILCTEDASKVLSNDGACPVCDQVLSKSHMKPVDINPNDEWTNMAMAGISPQTLMKSSYRSVMFYIGQKELEMQFKMNKMAVQCRQKMEAMQEKCTEKLEQFQNAYQKVAKRCHMMEQEIESLRKDKEELQEKFSEQSRQKRKLDEMYDQMRSEYESMKRSAIQPASNFYSRRNDADLFADPGVTMMDTREPNRNGLKEDIWSTRQTSATSGFGISGGNSPVNRQAQADLGNRRTGGNSAFGTAPGNPAMTLRNLIFSPIKRPQTRNRNNLFTL
ncbi:E3 ubiquitin-protein ligase CCNB1IP1 homolog [Linum grandiflorum]